MLEPSWVVWFSAVTPQSTPTLRKPPDPFTRLRPGVVTAAGLAAAVESYLSFDPDSSVNTDLLYRRALGALVDEGGGEVPVDRLEPGVVLDAFQRRWGQAKPNNWNTYRIPVQGLVA